MTMKEGWAMSWKYLHLESYMCNLQSKYYHMMGLGVCSPVLLALKKVTKQQIERLS